MLESRDEIKEPHNSVLYDLGSQNKRRIVLWVMNELRDGKFKLEAISDRDEISCNTSVEHTSSGGKSAGHVIIGVHVTLVLSSSRRGSTSVVAWHGDGSKRGRAMAITRQVEKPVALTRPCLTQKSNQGPLN